MDSAAADDKQYFCGLYGHTGRFLVRKIGEDGDYNIFNLNGDIVQVRKDKMHGNMFFFVDADFYNSED